MCDTNFLFEIFNENSEYVLPVLLSKLFMLAILYVESVSLENFSNISKSLITIDIYPF